MFEDNANGFTALIGPAGSGKSLTNDTQVLTPNGFIRNDELKVGGLVFSEDGHPTKVMKIHEGINLSMYRIEFSDGTWVNACGDHLWKVRHLEEEEEGHEVITTRTLRSCDYYNYSIPLCAPIQFEKKELSLHPYIVGLIISSGMESHAVTIEGPDPITNVVIKCSPSSKSKLMGVIKSLLPSDVSISAFNSRDIDSIGLSSSISNYKNTYVSLSNDYLQSSEEDRVWLLKGLMDGAGYIKLNHDGTTNTRFNTTNRSLVYKLIDLVRSLGGLASLDIEVEGINPRAYIVHIELKGINPFNLEKYQLFNMGRNKDPIKMITSIEYVGKEEGRCIEVENPLHTYIIKDFIVTHNSHTIRELLKGDSRYGIKTASTGIAAVNLQDETGSAVTINSALGFFDDKDLLFKVASKETDKALKKIADIYDRILIDELSMISSGVLSLIIRAITNFNTRQSRSLGLMGIGDFGQLAPVSGLPAFKSAMWSEFSTHYLTEIKRQSDKEFIEALSNLRLGKVNMAIDYFESEVGFNPTIDRDFAGSTFFSKNDDVDMYNRQALDKLNSVVKYYSSNRKGRLRTEWKNIPEVLELKEGCSVILLCNNSKLGYSNGDLATVIGLYNDYVEVELHRNGAVIPITYFETKNEMAGTSLGSVTYIPLRVAYGMTIHKCMPGYSLISTSRGLKRLSDIEVGDEAITSQNRSRKVLAKVNTGLKKSIRLTTKMGYSIETSEDHKLLVADSKGLEYKTSSSLLIGEMLCISRYRDVSDHVTNIPEVVYSSSRCKEINVPFYLTEEMSWFIGALIGNGCYTGKEGFVEFTNGETELLDKMKALVESYGINISVIPKKNTYKLYFTSRPLRDLMEKMGLNYVTAKDKVIPEIVMGSNSINKAALIAGLWDTDGSTRSRNLRYVTISKILADQLQTLLISLGIVSSINKQVNSADNWSYTVTICGTNIPKFRELIPLASSYKRESLDKAIEGLSKTGKTNVDFIPYGSEISSQVRNAIPSHKGIAYDDIHAEGHIKTNRLISNLILGTNSTSYNHLNLMSEDLKIRGIQEPELLRQALDTNYFYDEIVSIEVLEEVEMYDIEVEEDHSFVAQGFVTHNSQSLTLDSVQAKLGDPFMCRTHGMGYVLLSRVRTKEGLRLVCTREEFKRSFYIDPIYQDMIK
jgi:intein/homing endonuclease